jgi:hypothetical protein
LGSIIDFFDHAGFGQMFTAAAAAALGVGVLYALTTAKIPDEECLPQVSAPSTVPTLSTVVTREEIVVPAVGSSGCGRT